MKCTLVERQLAKLTLERQNVFIQLMFLLLFNIFFKIQSLFVDHLYLIAPANEVCEGYNFTGVCLSTGEVCHTHTPQDQRQTPPPRHTPPRQTPLLGRHPPGQSSPTQTPPPSACWDIVNKRAVRIPLECILVVKAKMDPITLVFRRLHMMDFSNSPLCITGDVELLTLLKIIQKCVIKINLSFWWNDWLKILDQKETGIDSCGSTSGY